MKGIFGVQDDLQPCSFFLRGKSNFNCKSKIGDRHGPHVNHAPNSDQGGPC